MKLTDRLVKDIFKAETWKLVNNIIEVLMNGEENG